MKEFIIITLIGAGTGLLAVALGTLSDRMGKNTTKPFCKRVCRPCGGRQSKICPPWKPNVKKLVRLAKKINKMTEEEKI